MDRFVLALWIITALAGAYLWVFASAAGRPESNARASRIPRWILFVHPALALGGLGIWAVHTAYGGAWLAWAAFVDLVLVAVLGDVMAIRTFKKRRDPALVTTAPGRDPAEVRRVEDQMPTIAILTHGVLGVGLIAAVLFEAVRSTW